MVIIATGSLSVMLAEFASTRSAIVGSWTRAAARPLLPFLVVLVADTIKRGYIIVHGGLSQHAGAVITVGEEIEAQFVPDHPNFKSLLRFGQFHVETVGVVMGEVHEMSSVMDNADPNSSTFLSLLAS